MLYQFMILTARKLLDRPLHIYMHITGFRRVKPAAIRVYSVLPWISNALDLW